MRENLPRRVILARCQKAPLPHGVFERIRIRIGSRTVAKIFFGWCEGCAKVFFLSVYMPQNLVVSLPARAYISLSERLCFRYYENSSVEKCQNVERVPTYVRM